MVMQWYDNGNAAEYLRNKNPSADRKQLVSVLITFSMLIPIESFPFD
jgi:hypothetical protein